MYHIIFVCYLYVLLVYVRLLVPTFVSFLITKRKLSLCPAPHFFLRTCEVSALHARYVHTTVPPHSAIRLEEFQSTPAEGSSPALIDGLKHFPEGERTEERPGNLWGADPAGAREGR